MRHVICPPASHGKVGGKSAGSSWPRRSSGSRRSTPRLSVTIRIPKPGTSRRTASSTSSSTTTSRTSTTGSTSRSTRSAASTRTSSRSSRTPTSRPRSSRASPSRSTTSRSGRSSSAARASSRTARARPSPASTRASSSRTRAPRGSAWPRSWTPIAEVYASIFGPDPIEYRAERGLLDVHEEMGIMIQEVVGTRVGKYFLPTFAGVAFSNNEFRWSPRIRRDDGLIRLVPGLGTRAVDRVGDDYPVLIAPGQPGLRANVTPDEVVRYSPRRSTSSTSRRGASRRSTWRPPRGVRRRVSPASSTSSRSRRRGIHRPS